MPKPKGWKNEGFRHALAKRQVKTSNQYLSEIKKHKEDEYFAQPTRARIDINNLKTTKDIIDYVSTVTASEVKRFGDSLIIDVKYRGIRGMVIIDPQGKKVDVFSRGLKPLDKFEKKHQEAILKDISPFVKDNTILDAELYALSETGDVLPQQVVTGYIKNPNDPKYKDVRTLIEVFDVMVVNKKDVRDMSLKQRKQLVEKALDYEGKVMYSAEFEETQNTKKAIDKELRETIKEGGEGVVIKNPESKYFYGKKGAKSDWVKVKNIDTIDLRLKSAEMYPVETSKSYNGLRFYKHFNLVPEDDTTHIINIDKGVKNAGFSNDYYIGFTKRLLNLVRQGKAKGEGQVPVDPSYQKIYGRKVMPKKIILPKAKQPIFEVITEEMSKDLKPTGQKLVGERPDKAKADTKRDLQTIYNSFYRKRAPVEDFQTTQEVS